VRISRSRLTGLATFVSAAEGKAIPTKAGVAKPITPIDFLAEQGQLFGISDPTKELPFDREETDALGFTHTTYSQVYGGVLVFSGVVKVHRNPAGEVVAANGHFYPISPKLSTAPVVNGADAATIALKALPADTPTVQHSELVVVDPGWYGDSSMGPHLAWYLILADASAGIEEAFFVDAHTGEILDQWTAIDNVRMREVHDAAGSSVLPGPLARTEGQPPVASAEVNKVYDYLGDTYDYYFRAFGRDGANNQGLTMVATVNSTAPNCPNAFWSGALQQMVFCANVTGDDVVAHETTHGVTQFSAGLIYQNQSGQLNESFSDVFGELVDLFNGNAAFPGTPGGIPWPSTPTGPGLDTPNHLRTACSAGASGYPDGVRWLLAEDSSAFANGAIRDMWDPTCHNHPDRANSPLMTCNPSDNGGVHSGSGVPNHAFAIVTDGQVFNGYSVSGIGPIKAGAVWYRALTVYLTVASDFEDAYVAFNQAAMDLIGTFPNDPLSGSPTTSMFTANDAVQVDLALQAVEMNTPGACGQADNVLSSEIPPNCADRTLIFADAFESGANGWTVWNSGPPTPYNWVQASSLPFGRPGTAWFCSDPNLGDCGALDESGTHTLTSPAISVPPGTNAPVLGFTHYLASEGGWDGGNVSLSVDGGVWQVVPRSAFIYNPYNARLKTAAQGNTDPLENQPAWSGAGGRWGTSQIDLRGLVNAGLDGAEIQFRFTFGKDGCTGVTGWYLDDFELYDCPDCNANGKPDYDDLVYAAASAPLGNIGDQSPQSFTLTAPPSAAAEGEVHLLFTAAADLSLASENISIDINGVPVGTVFVNSAGDCPNTPDSEELIVAASVFNAAVAGGDAAINMVGSVDVSANICGGSYITVFVRYPTTAADLNHNGVPDTCEPAVPGDYDHDFDVDLVDYAALRACLSGPVAGSITPACASGNFDGDSDIDLFDVAAFQQAFTGP
jgi:Zn-dependent metalloprotease